MVRMCSSILPTIFASRGRQPWVPHCVLMLGLLVLVSGEAERADADLSQKLELFDQLLHNQEQLLIKQQDQIQALEAGERRLVPANSSLPPSILPLTPSTRAYTAQENVENALTSSWLILCGILAMFVVAGQAMIESGSCRARNVQQVLVIKLAAVCMSSFGWWTVGWSFAYGGPFDSDGFKANLAGDDQFIAQGFLTARSDGQMEPSTRIQQWFFTWTFCAVAAGIVSGGLAERAHIVGFCLHSAVMSAFVYPIVVASTWGMGWIAKEFKDPVGFTDFAGAGVVHVTGGFAALAGSLVVRQRSKRFEGQSIGARMRGDPRGDPFATHSAPLLVLGTLLLWLGWFGLSCGSTRSMSTAESGFQAAQAAMNTVLAASAGGLIALMMRFLFIQRLELASFCGGIRAGLVAISAAAVNVESGSAIIIGLVGAAIYQLSSPLLKLMYVDDPIDNFAIHGIAGFWGVLAASIFDMGKGFDSFHGTLGFRCAGFDATSGCNGGTAAGGKPFIANLAGAALIAVWSFGISLVIFFVLRLPGIVTRRDHDILKASAMIQDDGIDTVFHYPAQGYVGEGASEWGENGPFTNPYFHSI